jgi:hypothetical protein
LTPFIVLFSEADRDLVGILGVFLMSMATSIVIYFVFLKPLLIILIKNFHDNI